MEKIENDSGTNSFDSIFARLDPNSQAKIVCGVRHREPLDEEEDFFEIGLSLRSLRRFTCFLHTTEQTTPVRRCSSTSQRHCNTCGDSEKIYPPSDAAYADNAYGRRGDR